MSWGATDVWYFCRASNSQIKPVKPPPDQELILTTKPHSPFVTCKLCKCVFPSFFLEMWFLYCKIYLLREWHIYKNMDGVTTTIWAHLKQRHSEEYEKVVSLLKLKHSGDLDHPTVPTPSHQGPFELDEWIRLMVRWIVTGPWSLYCPKWPSSIQRRAFT